MMATRMLIVAVESRAIDHTHPHRRLTRLCRRYRTHRSPWRQRDHTLLLSHIHQARPPRRLTPHHLYPSLARPRLSHCALRSRQDPFSHYHRAPDGRRRKEEGGYGCCHETDRVEIQVQAA